MNSKKIIKNGRNVGAGPVSAEQNGITLIALVITIIVLLILAGVTISMVLGDDGIIEQAAKAKEAQENAEKKQNEDLLNLNMAMDGYETGYIYSEIDGEIYITGDKVIKDGYKTGDKITISEGVEGTVVVYGDLDGNGVSNFNDENIYRSHYSEDSINCYMLAWDKDHDGYITGKDNSLYYGVSIEAINQNVKAQKLKPLPTDEMTDADLIEYLEITNSAISDKNSEDAYEITLNKEYTYAELYNYINEKVDCRVISFYTENWSSIKGEGNDTLVGTGSLVEIEFYSGTILLEGTKVYNGGYILLQIN